MLVVILGFPKTFFYIMYFFLLDLGFFGIKNLTRILATRSLFFLLLNDYQLLGTKIKNKD